MVIDQPARSSRSSHSALLPRRTGMRKLSISAAASAAPAARAVAFALVFAGALVFGALGGAAVAGPGRSIEYMSQHPLPRKVGHGFCYIDVPHFHDFPPSDA